MANSWRSSVIDFWLGTHQVDWLARAGVPLMVSVRRLRMRRKLPRASARWWQDSNGFNELRLRGEYTYTPRQYVEYTRHHQAEVGSLAYASPQDWMCESVVLERTGLTVEDHQRRTIESLLDLREIAPDVPWVPVLQGWADWEYMRHVEMYARAGVDLVREPIVGVGTLCRRQGMRSAVGILRHLELCGLRLHGFGFKLTGLRSCAKQLASSDSMAWSYSARKQRQPCPAGLSHGHCGNCLEYALLWRQRVLDVLGLSKRPVQLGMSLL